MTVSTGAGCEASATVLVTIKALPEGQASSNAPVCEGTTVQLNAAGGDAYLWKGPKKFTSTEPSPSFAAETNLSGTYTVTIGKGSCSVTKTVEVEINPLPKISISTTSGKPAVCGTDALGLTATPLEGATYQWKKDNVPLGLSSNTIAVQSAGVYTVEASSRGCVSTQSITISQQANPVAIADFRFPKGDTTIRLLAEPDGMQYAWTGPQNFASTQRNPSISPYKSVHLGKYTLVVTDKATGCKGTATTTVALPNSRLGVEETTAAVKGMEVVVSPNPTNGNLRLEVRLAEPASLVVEWIDLQGKVNQQWASGESKVLHQLQLDVTAYAEGLYFLRVGTSSGKKHTTKILRQAH